MPRKNTPDAARWKLVHNRKPGEKKGGMRFLELRSPAEVGKIMGLTRQRIQQIEREAVFKLRRGLKEFADDFFLT